jgi:YD repeat-containing protein
VTRFHHRIEERNIFKTSTATFDALPFDYDANGNVAAISDGATGRVGRGDRTMAYDALDRLMSAASPMFGKGTTGTVAFTHDVLDNLVNLNMPATGPTHPMPARNQFYCYDTNWRLTSLRDADGCAGSALNTLTYDVQGNVASKDGLTYDFDFGNRLREVDAGATLAESYRYDAYGRRALSFAPSGNLLSFYDQAGQRGRMG